MQRFEGSFSDWKDVSREFSGDWSDEGESKIPEPDEVVFAHYHQASYEGDAIVIFRKGDKYFVAEGSHCSCFGLEGQFEPCEYRLGTLIEALKRRHDYGCFAEPHKANVIALLEARMQQVG